MDVPLGILSPFPHLSILNYWFLVDRQFWAFDFSDLEALCNLMIFILFHYFDTFVLTSNLGVCWNSIFTVWTFHISIWSFDTQPGSSKTIFIILLGQLKSWSFEFLYRNAPICGLALRPLLLCHNSDDLF